MKVDNVNIYSGLYDYPNKYNEEVIQDSVVDVEASKPKDSLLSLIYAPDPRTGLPTGDLVYLVSDKANPQVKQFILDNLMMDVSSAVAPKVPAELSDDDAFALSRQPNEDVQAYVERLNSSVERDKWIMDQYKKQQNVSVESK